MFKGDWTMSSNTINYFEVWGGDWRSSTTHEDKQAKHSTHQATQG
jgi:hypothetical protein